MRQLATRLGETDRDHTRAVADLAAANTAVTAAEEAERQAETATARVRAQVRVSAAEWSAQHQRLVRDLAVPELSGRLDVAIDRIGEPGAATLREVYGEVVGDAVAARRDAQATLNARWETLAERRAGLLVERDRIAAEHDDAPPTPATRPAARTGRPGAALWQLVRFADDVAEADAAAVEAALQAAGLLDAWIHPEPDATTAALADRVHDGYLRPVPPERRPTGRTLGDVLVPEVQDAVAAATIAAVLSSIALVDDATVADEAPATIDRSGRYVQGVGIGSHTKPVAEYIGATARAARRAARIAEYERLLADLDAEIGTVERDRTALALLLADVDAGASTLPSVAGIQAALRELDRAAAVVRAQQTAAEAAAARLDQAVAERSTAAANLRRGASERSLPAERVDEVADALRRFERSGMRLEAADETATRAAGVAVEARARHEEAVARHLAAAQAERRAVARHAEKEEAFGTLRSAIGVAAEQVLAEVAQVSDEIAAAESRLSALREERAVAQQAVASARTRVELGEQALADAEREAYADSLRLRPYAHPDLLSLLRCPVALRWPARLEEGGVDPQVAALHEAILTATKELNTTEVSLKQSATRLTTALTELQAQLPAAGLDHRPEWDTDDGVIVVRIADEQGLTPVAHFGERIGRERRDQEQLLTEAEQRVLEDALLGQLAKQIHHRTIDARDLVDGMDTRMRARRMSSGLTVGVGWQLSDELDADQREACKLLERDPARLGPGQLTTLRRHFAARIKAARAAAPEQPYRELLAQVLDYRQWRVFAFTLHRPGGGTEALTRARHSQLSGGEQSVSLHLPLFAAANALFASARPAAPRLLGLDEAFAGVDENGRGELMSLARQFDLDLFMTGYDLWAAHPSVTGAAHYDLSHSAVHHALSTVLLVWDGTANVADFDGTLARSLGSPESRRAAGCSAGVIPATASAEVGSADRFDE